MKKQELSKKALDICEALLKLPEEERQLIFRKVSQPETTEPIRKQPKEKGNCPHYGSSHVSGDGKTPSGCQRFICVDCRRTFRETEKPVWAGSHFPREVREEYIRLMSMGATIKELAEALGINPTTASYWRHKILTALKDGKSDTILEQYTQADETFTYLSTKGNRNADNNLHRYEASNRDPDYKNARESGHRHGRGSCSCTRGLNNGLVCTIFSIGENGVCWGKLSNMGSPTSADLDAVYAVHLGDSVILVTDASSAARKYAQEKELHIIQLKSKTESRQGKHNLQKINNLHSAFKKDLAGYKGVSTKHLENYAHLTVFKQETPDISAIARATMLTDRMERVPSVTRWKDMRAKDYPLFVYEALDTTPGDEIPI